MWSKPTIAKIKGPQPRCCNGWGCSQNKLLICGTLLWGHHNACPDSGCHHQPGCCHHPPLGPKINLIQLQKDQQIRTSSKQLAPQAQRVVLRPHSPLGRGSHWLACIGCWTEALISVLGGSRKQRSRESVVERNRSLPGKAVLCLQCVSPWLVEKRLSSSLEAPGARASGLRVQWLHEGW